MLADIPLPQLVGRFLDTFSFAAIGVWAVYFYPRRIDRELRDQSISFDAAPEKRERQKRSRMFGFAMLAIATVRLVFVL
jgi:hypothetical protein